MAPGFIAQAWPSARDRAWKMPGLEMDSIGSVLICGCGDSHHAALSLEFSLAEWSTLRVRAAHAMAAARYLLPQYRPSASETLVVGISASGEVARTLEAIEQARDAGFRTLALTSQQQSSLASAAEHSWTLPLPEIPFGPGLLSYLASLLMGYALAGMCAPEDRKQAIDRVMNQLPDLLDPWQRLEQAKAQSLAEVVDAELPVIYLGSGPSFGSASYAAAKAIEASGISARGQDVEEWAHLEYFCDPPNLLVWLLSSGGRSRSREREVLLAAATLGRRVHQSRWEGEPAWDEIMKEAIGPLALWAGPVAFADRLMERLGERPFRGFAGGRSQAEGGGISQIRTSARLSRHAMSRGATL